jgi:DNA mismatch repair protein MutS
VVERAKSVLQALEQGDRKGGARPAALIDDLPLFRAAPPATLAAPALPSAVEARLRQVLPDDLTPMEALRLVYDLRRMLDDAPG